MTEQVTVELRLVDQYLKLSTTEAEQPELQRAAHLLNEKFNDMRRNAPRAENYKLSLMVSLQLMQEVLALNKTVQHYEQCERMLNDLMLDIEHNHKQPNLD